jgi:topoisomerase-4 subunit A
MYENYFLDYASYVILERAVPVIEDGCKPVQRRILHSMKQMDDGRYNKVANIIGHTMQYHPHGDASIGDALVGLGQKDLLIDTQGNWGDYRTGDSAAAPRYIEARLTKFALEVMFNSDTTIWQPTYDGRNQEPVYLPAKFPLLLAQGVEGIAVGLATKVLPHNFNELLDACIAHLKGKSFKLYPDFPTGGLADVADYNSGMRGGKIISRARMEPSGKSLILIKDLPFGVTCDKLIESIIKANDKGHIKIKKITDNTAMEVEIAIELQPGISIDQTIDALYHFTDCSISISTFACVIVEDKPLFLSVEEILRMNVEQTKYLLMRELEIQLEDLTEKWFNTSLEKIFIEQRIYRDIEEAESFERAKEIIYNGLLKYVQFPSNPKPKKQLASLHRDITDEDIIRLTEIKIKKISKYSSFETDELLKSIEDQIAETRHHLAHLVEYTINWFDHLKKKYGKGRERKTVLSSFEAIEAVAVVQNNAKLYVNREEGFVGFGLKKDEFVADCSDLDDIIAFTAEGTFMVTRLAEKTFIGKDIIHVAVWNKNDDRTTYNLIYSDGKSGSTFAKRFNVQGITRDRPYDLTGEATKPKVQYFTANLNGEAEKVKVQLQPSTKAKIKIFEFDFSELAIKGRNSKGNIVTKYAVKKIALEEIGGSTLGAQLLYYDEEIKRINVDGKGRQLGEIDFNSRLLAVYGDGTLELLPVDMAIRFEDRHLLHLSIFNPATVISCVYFDGVKGWTMVKRFHIETEQLMSKFHYITEHPDSEVLFISASASPAVHYKLKVRSKWIDSEVNLSDIISVKGWKAAGNRLSSEKLKGFKEITSHTTDTGQVQIGETLEIKFEPKQGSLFDE